MIHKRVLAAICLTSLMAGPAYSQTNSGGGTRLLGSEAGLKEGIPGARPVRKPVDIGIGTAVKPALKGKDLTASAIGAGSGEQGSVVGPGTGGAIVATGPARPPQPTTACPAGKAWAFSDALNTWNCL